jgi:hypothetical protein
MIWIPFNAESRVQFRQGSFFPVGCRSGFLAVHSGETPSSHKAQEKANGHASEKRKPDIHRIYTLVKMKASGQTGLLVEIQNDPSITQ